VCLASGGSSGLRGLFVQTLDEYAAFIASVLRRVMATAIPPTAAPPKGGVAALIAAAAPVHASGLLGALCAGYPFRLISVPATLRLEEAVDRLNDANPAIVLGHTSKLALLAQEQQAGRLRITPLSVTAMGEPVTDEDRTLIATAFGVPPITQFNSTEGLVGPSEPGGAVSRFAIDMCIAEPVDADNRPVSIGTPSEKVLITNLYNHTRPLIRYELTDRFTPHPAAPNDSYLHATVQGRSDDAFRYRTITIDPLAIRTVMVKTPAASEYQVRQTENGLDLLVVTETNLDQEQLEPGSSTAFESLACPTQSFRCERCENFPGTPRPARSADSSPCEPDCSNHSSAKPTATPRSASWIARSYRATVAEQITRL
jgi:phenylacetate-CoA ligase